VVRVRIRRFRGPGTALRGKTNAPVGFRAFELQPALLALLSDVRTGEACGIINIFLRSDGSDRLRDKKGSYTWLASSLLDRAPLRDR
jgi:hypothetical protein